MRHGWIGVDLDRTLAHYDTWVDAGHIGEPVPLMVERVKIWLEQGIEVRIVTARVYTDGSLERNIESQFARKAIEQWLIQVFGRKLPVTCTKDFDMLELWDDRAVQVIPNTGKRADGLDLN